MIFLLPVFLVVGGVAVVFAASRSGTEKTGPTPTPGNAGGVVAPVLISPPSVLPAADVAPVKKVPAKPGTGGTALPAVALPALAPLFGGGATAAGGITAAGVGFSAALVAAAGAVGYGITGDIGGAAGAVYELGLGLATGNAGIFTSQVGNIGRVLGREIDRVLGGDGTHGTGAVYQGAGYAAGLTIGLYGLQAVPFVGQLVGLVIIVGSIVSDTIRLDDTRSGRVMVAAKAEARAVFDRTYTAAQAAVLNAGYSLANDDRSLMQCFAMAFARGWWRERNDRRREVWLKKPRGIGLNAAQHEAYGKARGYWVDENEVINEIQQWAWREWQEIAARDYGPSMAEQERKGELFAICAEYMEAVSVPKDPFVFSEKAHADKWKAAGAFPGTVAENGDLNLPLGGRLDRAASLTQKKFIIRSV